MWVKADKNEWNECPICLSAFDEDEKARMLSYPCMHAACAECVSVLQQTNRCSICCRGVRAYLRDFSFKPLRLSSEASEVVTV